MKFVFVYITAPSEEKAIEMARHLLERRLIACANTFPVRSLYHWEGKISDEKEHVLIAKTTESMFEKTKEEVEKIHPYSVPCIAKISVEPNKTYADWLLGELEKHPKTDKSI